MGITSNSRTNQSDIKHARFIVNQSFLKLSLKHHYDPKNLNNLSALV